MLFLPCTKEQKYSAKQAIDSFFVRLGDVLSAAVVYIGTTWLSFNSRTFAIVNLVLVVLCALAAAFTTVRASSSAASAAAGTSIGISLVPPLCVVGFGLGVADAAIAEGALLLFTANFCAILLCAGLFFAVVGFRSSDAREDIDRDIGLVVGGPFARLIAIVQTGLNSRWRILWRVGVPFLLFCARVRPADKGTAADGLAGSDAIGGQRHRETRGGAERRDLAQLGSGAGLGIGRSRDRRRRGCGGRD